jgi:hypothetical protein
MIFETPWFWNRGFGFVDFGMKLFCLALQESCDSLVVVVPRQPSKPWQPKNHGSFHGRGKIFQSSPKRADRLYVRFIQWILEVFPPGLRRVKLITHLHLVPRLRMSGSITPLSHLSKWHAQRFYLLSCFAEAGYTTRNYHIF